MTSGSTASWLEEELAEGENVLWQGRPDAGFWLLGRHWLLMITIAACCTGAGGYALYVMAQDPDAPAWAYYYFGFLALLGIAVIPLSAFGDRSVRRQTQYVLTDRRAIAFRRGNVKSYPVEEWVAPHVVSDGRGTETLIFHERRMFRALIEEGFDALDDVSEVRELAQRLYAGR